MMTLTLFVQHGLSRELAEGTERPLLRASPPAARAGAAAGDGPLGEEKQEGLTGLMLMIPKLMLYR